MVYIIVNSDEYTGDGYNLIAVFGDKKTADRICKALNKIAEHDDLHGTFYGFYEVKELEVLTQASEFAQKWELSRIHQEEDWPDLLKAQPKPIRKLLEQLGFLEKSG